MTTLVDSNVLLDVIQPGGPWEAWSAAALASALDDGQVFINPIIYAEASVRFATPADVDDALPSTLYGRQPLPYAAGFLAGKAYQMYRANGGERRSPMPDFYIGAHAIVSGYRLLTRDPRRYRAYFPKLPLIAPD